MKKIFVALMAVLVLASCGGNKKEATPDAPAKVEATAAPQKKAETPGEVMMLAVDVVNKASDKMQKAETADDVINALSAMIEEMKSLKENYGDMVAQVDEAEVQEKYAKEMEAVKEAVMKYYAVLVELDERIEITPEDEEKLNNLMESVGEF